MKKTKIYFDILQEIVTLTRINIAEDNLFLFFSNEQQTKIEKNE
jgi:hypothetical protein